jgi:hypothetical protein
MMGINSGGLAMESSLPKDPVNLQLTLALRGLADRGLIADEQGPERFIHLAEQISQALLQNPVGKRIYQALAMTAFGFPRPVEDFAPGDVGRSTSSTPDSNVLAFIVLNWVKSLETTAQPALPTATIDPENIAKMITAFAQSAGPR